MKREGKKEQLRASGTGMAIQGSLLCVRHFGVTCFIFLHSNSHRIKVIKWNKSKGEVKIMIRKGIFE